MTFSRIQPKGRPVSAAVCALFLTSLPILAQAQDAEPGVQLLDYGVICDIELQGERAAPMTESGKLNIIDQDRGIDLTINSIPAEIGLSFGIQTMLPDNIDLSAARVVVTHPPMGKDGVQWQSWNASMDFGSPSINLFTFEHGYELVEGRWTFQVVTDETILLEQAFDILPRGSVPAIQDLCFGAQIMS